MCKQNFAFVSSFFLFFILHSWTFSHKTQACALIKLKLCKNKGFIKAHLCTKESNKDLWSYTFKIRSKVCHAYKANCLPESVEIWPVDGVIITAVPFCDLKWIELKNTETWNKIQSWSKLWSLFLWIKNL